jgi:hypothetical protein
MSTTKHYKPYNPAVIITILIVLAYGIMTLSQLYLAQDSFPIKKSLGVGGDFVCVYLSTEYLMEGVSPLALKWNTYPPLVSFMFYPLWLLDLMTARHVMFFLMLSAVLGAYFFSTSSFESIEKKDRSIILLCGLIIILLSYPANFLIFRGHLLGIVIMLLAMGIYLFKKNNPASSICFALSIGMVIFPVLILVPLLFFRRYKIFFYTILTFIILVLYCPGLWFEFMDEILLDRIKSAGWYMVEQNCSLINTFYFLWLIINKMLSLAGLPLLRKEYWDALPYILYPTMFFTMAVADFQIRRKNKQLDKEIEIALMMMYLPFMIAVPKVVFQYSLVLLLLLIPAVCTLTQKFRNSLPKSLLWLFIGGLALSQIQAHALQQLFKLSGSLPHFFPGFGLFIVMIGCVAFKVWFWRRGYRELLPDNFTNL